MRLLATVAIAALLSIVLTAASADGASASSRSLSARTSILRTSTLTTSTSSPSGDDAETPIPVALSTVPPAAHRLSSDQVLAIANRLPKMRGLRREFHGSFGDVYLKGGFQWQVSYFTHNGKKEIGVVVIDDLSGKVVEQWTGFQVAWTMARGYPGAFGRHVNALYVWLPMCLLFFVPFFNYRKPFSLLHLDLLMLLSLSVSSTTRTSGRRSR
jgi:hypothetical protein